MQLHHLYRSCCTSEQDAIYSFTTTCTNSGIANATSSSLYIDNTQCIIYTIRLGHSETSNTCRTTLIVDKML